MRDIMNNVESESKGEGKFSQESKFSQETIMVANKILQDKRITDEGLMVYVSILSITKGCRRSIEYLVYDSLAYEVSDIVNNKNVITAVKAGIYNLNEIGFIKVIDTKDKGVLVDVSNLYFSTNLKDECFSFYVSIYRNEVLKIINSKMKFKMKLLRYFICLLSTINHKDVSGDINHYCKNVGSRSIKELSDISMLSESAVLDYNKWLEDNELIYIKRADVCLVSDTGVVIKKFTNAYGRMVDKDRIDMFQNKIRIKYGANKSSHIKTLRMTNNNRRITALLNQIKQGKDYPLSVLEEVMQHCKDYNDNCISAKKRQRYSIEDIEMLESKIQQQDSAQELDDIFDDELDYRPEGKRKGEDSSVPQ